MTDTVLLQIMSLSRKTTPQLEELWRSLFHTDPPRCSRTYLIRRLTTRLQELAYGALPGKVVKELENMMDQMKKGKKFTNHFVTNKPRTGTKLVREYQGISHEVIVAEKGYVYQGQLYKSLSVIARTITGTRWSGPKFFGLRDDNKAVA